MLTVCQVILMPTAATPKSPEWYDLQTSKHCPDKALKIRITIRIDKPQNMKHFGYYNLIHWTSCCLSLC